MKIDFAGGFIFDRPMVKKVLKTASLYLNQPQQTRVSVCFADKEKIRGLNFAYRGIDSPTDVLSFPLVAADYKKPFDLAEYKTDLDPESGELPLGDIVICRSVAKEQAADYGHGLKREICFLALHGYLHLVGFDHVGAEDSAAMERAQEEILAKAKVTR